MSADGLQRARALRPPALAFLVVGAFVAPAAWAGTITLDVRTRCEAGPAAVRCAVEISNRGDEAALELTADVEAGARAERAGIRARLAPGETWTFDVDVEPDRLRPGRTPVLVRVGYRDEGGYPLSALSWGLLESGAGRSLDFDATLDSIALRGDDAATTIHIQGLAPTTDPVTVRLILPGELGVVGPSAARVHPDADGTAEASFRVQNVSGFPGSSYEILALVETRSADSRDAHFVPATVRLEPPPLAAERIRPALVALLVVLAGWIATRRLRAVATPEAGRDGGMLLDVSVLAAVLLFLAGLVPIDLLLAPTTAAGGDTASHVLTARYLVETLLPEGRLLGWMPGNLAGYPIFQLYFPLPFLVMAALAPLVGLAVGFKLVTLLGSFLLPLCAYFGFRALGFRRPTPAIAAVLVLPFLLVDTNTVFGGNLPSTLAGEFSYSLGLSLAILFLGTSFRGLVERRLVVPNAILLALIALAHAYALLLAGAFAAAHLLWLPGVRRNIGYLARMYGLAFALIGFWILPLLGYAEFTSPYRDIWRISTWREVLPPILLPLVTVSILATAAILIRLRAGSKRPFVVPARVATLVGAGCAGLLLYRLTPLLGAVDVRFLPPVQLLVALAAAPVLGIVARRVRPIPASTWLVVGATLLWCGSHVGFVPQWMRWNYSGFEHKPLWKAYTEVQRTLAGDETDPRVVFEHTPAHNAAGSIRAFESLPLFSGRSTLEGLYIQSSLVTPEIFYLQSEISEVASCPLPDYHCARLDPERAAEHLRQFNVDRVVARSAAVRTALRESDQYELDSEIPPYEIHRVRGGDGRYVVPLETAPVLLDTDDWKSAFFRWFKRPGSSRTVLVWRQDPDAKDRARFGPPLDRLPERVEGRPLDRGTIGVEESLEPHRITIRTDRPGHPLLVKVSYHPRWRARTGERIYLASPGFMLVVPKGREVVLEFGDPPLVQLGHMSTLFGLAVVLAVAVGRPSQRRRTPVPSVEPPAHSGATLARRSTLIVATAAIAWTATAGIGASFPPLLYEKGLELYKQERFEEASRELERAIDAGPLSSAAVHASFYRALSAYRSERWSEAADRFEKMIVEYPESPYHVEARYHVGLCRRNADDRAAARIAFRAVTEHFPDSDWAPRAAERLAEIAPLETGDNDNERT
jgi:hypothetical protein